MSDTPRTDALIAAYALDIKDGAWKRLEDGFRTLERELAAASGRLDDINDALRTILKDDIEGMERERIEELADELAAAQSLSVRSLTMASTQQYHEPITNQ